MTQINFNINYGINSDLVISPKEIRDIYLFGVNIKDQNGASLDDEAVKFYIRSAQGQLEDYLYVKFKKQVIEESLTFYSEDFLRWGFIKTTYQVVCPLLLEGWFNTTKQVTYPKGWLSVKTSNTQDDVHRQINLVPAGSSTTHSEALTISGVVPQLGYAGWKDIPNYWKVRYVTGFTKMPAELVDIVGKLAAIQLFNIAGDLILGSAGIASQSLSIDGLSQSISTTSSATNSGYGSRILMYTNELKKSLPDIKDQYKGFSFGVL